MIVGLALRLRTTLVVVTAGVVTGLLAGLPLFTNQGIFEGLPYLTKAGSQEGIINMLGRAFAENRLMTLFILTLPAIGLAERYGLQEQSARFVRRIRRDDGFRFSTTDTRGIRRRITGEAAGTGREPRAHERAASGG